MTMSADGHGAAFGPETALVVVDVQNDFADPAGSLFVPDGTSVVAPINDLIAAARRARATIVLTQDWHPPVTPHFQTDGGVWPVHCIRQTWGADLHPGLSTDADLVLRKGTGGEDGYSAFTVADPEGHDTRPTGLAAYLRERGVTKLVIVGLAGDVCVSATAIDGAEAGFDTTVLWHATRSVAIDGGEPQRSLDAMRRAGVDVVGTGR